MNEINELIEFKNELYFTRNKIDELRNRKNKFLQFCEKNCEITNTNMDERFGNCIHILRSALAGTCTTKTHNLMISNINKIIKSYERAQSNEL